MNTRVATKNKAGDISTVLSELRLLRTEVRGLYEQETLRSYANPKRVKRSYESALKNFPRGNR